MLIYYVVIGEKFEYQKLNIDEIGDSDLRICIKMDGYYITNSNYYTEIFIDGNYEYLPDNIIRIISQIKAEERNNKIIRIIENEE